MTDFELRKMEDGGTQVLDFANHTANFVEVVVAIDGREVRGYCYPPYYHKPIRKMRSGEALPFGQSGRIKAYIYSGMGNFKDEDVDYDVPPFIRLRLNQERFKKEGLSLDLFSKQKTNRKVTFKRFSNNPIAVLEIPY